MEIRSRLFFDDRQGLEKRAGEISPGKVLTTVPTVHGHGGTEIGKRVVLLAEWRGVRMTSRGLASFSSSDEEEPGDGNDAREQAALH